MDKKNIGRTRTPETRGSDPHKRVALVSGPASEDEAWLVRPEELEKRYRAMKQSRNDAAVPVIMDRFMQIRTPRVHLLRMQEKHK